MKEITVLPCCTILKTGCPNEKLDPIFAVIAATITKTALDAAREFGPLLGNNLSEGGVNDHIPIFHSLLFLLLKLAA